MNNLLIPPSPNWYESRILACSVDNTVVYGTRNDVVVIRPTEKDKEADIKIFPPAHYGRILSVDINQNWGPGNQLIVSAGDDKTIHLWDAETRTLKSSNNTHTSQTEKLIGSVFMGSDKIVSVSENGFVSLWRFKSGEVVTFKNLFNSKARVTTLSACPHVSWMAAFGLHCGLVVIADLRRSGRVVYRLRGHDKSIVSLTWCPTPFNIFPKKVSLFQKLSNVSQKVLGEEPVNSDNTVKIQDVPKLESDVDVSKIEECNFPKKKMEEMETDTVECAQTSDKNCVEKDQNISSPKDIVESSVPRTEEHPVNLLEMSPEEGVDKTTDDKVPPIMQETCEITASISENISLGALSTEDSSETQFQEISNNQTPTEDSDIIENDDALNSEVNGSQINIKENSTPELDDAVNDEAFANATKEYLLASSARGGSIFIWRAGTDGRKQTELFIGGNKNKKWRSGDKSWISLCWISPDILLSSSPSGELLQWDLLKANNKGAPGQKKLVHHDHNSNLFVIAAPMVLVQEWNNDIRRQELFAWTIGQERYLLSTSLKADRTLLASYPTIGGSIFTIRSSPLDPTRLAVGIGDNTAKVWDLSRPHKQCVTMGNLWQKIQSKVMALAWHPQKETILAYATAEGRIGIVNTSSKNPSLLCQYFRNAIPDIQWGPIEGNQENLGLYAVGEGKLVVYNTSNENKVDPQLVESPTKEHMQCLAWKTDFSLLACGTRAGAIVVYDTYLNHITTIFSEYKITYCIVWHPLATSKDEGTSPMASWLAISSSCKSVVIFDIPTDKANNEQKLEVAVLNRHTKPVRCISWSPFVGGRIVSGGDDGVIFVWDVQTKVVLATYVEHNLEPILMVLWSPLDESFIISTGKDNCIRVWNITEHKPKSSEDIAIAQKPYSLFRFEKRKLNKETNEDVEEEAPKVHRHAMLSLTSKAQNSLENGLNDCIRLFKTLNQDENEEADRTHSLINGFDVLKMFGDKNSMVDLLNDEQKNHQEKKKIYSKQHILLWKGDVAELVKTSIANGNVSPWLISLAPMISIEFWKEACEVYAKKLMEDAKSDPIETVSYLLICHKVEEAIEVLCNATLFREALALAKCRLSKNDPTINEVLKKWATFGIMTGTYEISAQCFIALGRYEEAAKALFRRTNVDALKFSVVLAEKSGNKDLIDACALRYNSFKNVGEGDEAHNGTSIEKEETKDGCGREDLSGGENLLVRSEVPSEG